MCVWVSVDPTRVLVFTLRCCVGPKTDNVSTAVDRLRLTDPMCISDPEHSVGSERTQTEPDWSSSQSTVKQTLMENVCRCRTRSVLLHHLFCSSEHRNGPELHEHLNIFTAQIHQVQHLHELSLWGAGTSAGPGGSAGAAHQQIPCTWRSLDLVRTRRCETLRHHQQSEETTEAVMSLSDHTEGLVLDERGRERVCVCVCVCYIMVT